MLHNTPEHFKTKFVKEDDGCWIWQGPVAKNGYGKTTLKSRHTSVHRVSYLLYVGEIPEGLHIDHLCLNKLCANPEHLEAVSQLENTRRYYKQQTHCTRGHLYDERNTYIRPDTKYRACKKCRALKTRECQERSLVTSS